MDPSEKLQALRLDSEAASGMTRRSFVRQGTAAICGITAVAAAGVSTVAAQVNPEANSEARVRKGKTSFKAPSFLDLLRIPDGITVYRRFEDSPRSGKIRLEPRGNEWRGGEALIETKVERGSMVLTLAAPSIPVAAVHVRWRAGVAAGLRVLGDAWERSYGDLGWCNLVPERIMPWYFATFDGSACHGYGVRTDVRALSFWQLDPEGVSLWLNVANGGDGVQLGQRQLTMATVVTRRGADGEDAMDAISALCRAMCARQSRPSVPIYGANDWDHTYGHSTAASILQDTDLIAELSPAGGVRPFSVIDDGWQKGPPNWPDMKKLAGAIKQRTVRPGIWIRPLKAAPGSAQGLLLPDARFSEQKARTRNLAYDPTIPEAQEKICAQLHAAQAWDFEMVKHDFSTLDLLGQWGFEMGPRPTLPGWSLNDRSRTNAEVLTDLYALIRKTVGESMLLDGCNTIGHLGQGFFDMQRTGDDTSGRQWERTRRMGINTLAFRLPQQGTFFTVDPDMAGITEDVPWEFTRQWLDVLARSGTATIISAGAPAMGPEQRAAVRDAFQIAAAGGVGARPVDWMETSSPENWRESKGAGAGKLHRYHWSGPEGAFPMMNP